MQPSLPGMEPPPKTKPLAIIHTLEADLHWECIRHPMSKDGEVLLLYCVDPRGGAAAVPITSDASEELLLDLCAELVGIHWLICRKHGVRRVEIGHV